MKIKGFIFLIGILIVVSCNNNHKKVVVELPSKDSVHNYKSNFFTADINGRKTIDSFPLIIFRKNNFPIKERLTISGVFKDIDSHIGLVLVKDSGSILPGRFLLQEKDDEKTNARYETNINGGAIPIENTLYKASGTITVTAFDTAVKRIEADIEMDAVNKINRKVHIIGHISSNYK